MAVNEGNSRHIAARIPHPDGAALGTAFGFVRKNVNNTKQLNPGSSIKQDVNRLGNFRVKRVSRQMKEIAGISRRESRTLMGRLMLRRLGSCIKM
jgi:hypothetical protein